MLRAGLDYLASPTGAISAAQALAAGVWGADATWFLVNGTTVGIHAAVMATCGPGDVLLLARNAHLSAFNAMVLAGGTAMGDSSWGVCRTGLPKGSTQVYEHWRPRIVCFNQPGR